MSRVDELIQEYCPEGVRFATLDELCEVANNKRNPIKSSLRVPGNTPYYGANNIQDYVEGFTHDGEYVLIAEDGSASLSNYSVQFATGKFWANNHVHVIRGRDGVDNRFLFHFFGTMNFMPYLTGGTRAKLNKSKLLEIKIPIPPLEVQKEIVNILDKFTQLEAELEVELDARRRQYEYYRNYLLAYSDSENEVEWFELGEVMKIVRGASPRPINSFFTSDRDGVNWIKIGDVKPDAKYITSTKQKITKAGASKSRILKPGDFVLSNSMSFGRPYILSIEGCIHDGWISMSNYEEKLVADFLYHLLNSEYVQKIWRQKASNGTVQNLNTDIVRATKIPIPRKSEQRRVADLLDKFDLLLNSASEGLPAEINARRKQYEYYRTKLLTFQELPS